MTRLLQPTRIVLDRGPTMEFTVEGRILAVTADVAPGNPYRPAPPALMVHCLTEEERFTDLWIADAFVSWAVPKGAEHLATVTVPLLSPEGRIVDALTAHVFARPK